MSRDDFVARYDHRILGAEMRAVFGQRGYYNVGLWDEAVVSQEQACVQLSDLVIDRLLPVEGLLLDVGCGLGATTARLAARAPGSRVQGINVSPAQVEDARRRHPGLDFAVVDATQMPFVSATIGGLLSIEAMFHFGTRSAFLSEAARVLVPKGRLAATDLIGVDRDALGSWMIPSDNAVADERVYVAAYEAAGLRVTDLLDVTDRTWRPFCARQSAAAPHGSATRRYFERLEASATYVLVAAERT